MSERLTHSKPAIASTILPLAIRIYLAVMYVLFFKCESCLNLLNRTMGNSFGALGVTVIVFIVLIGIIPIGGHIFGLTFAIIGLCQKNRKRAFAVIGLILNGLPLVIYVVYRLVTNLSVGN